MFDKNNKFQKQIEHDKHINEKKLMKDRMRNAN